VKTVAAEAEPVVRPRPEHPISRSSISENTLKVLYRLHKTGYKAYLCGGGVRDLLLGRQPKDFDVVTDARPEQIRRVFRNSRVIGRRFRLVHIFFGGEIVEVATFRREPDPEEQEGDEDEALLITSDNTYGTPREDAFRRDFTVNALFYDIADFSVIDYVGGLADLDQRVIRAIGDPDVRFQEDPVRMVRACEFAGRLGFRIERRTQEAIQRQRKELDKAAPARLTDELIQLLRCGHAGRAFQWMHDLGLLEVLLPEAYAMVAASERGLGDFGQVLPAVDGLITEGRELADTALLAALLLPSVLLRRLDVEALDQRPMTRTALAELVAEVVAPLFQRFTLSRDRATRVERALTGFLRLCEPGWGAAERVRFARRPSFDDALTLFEIMTRATGEGAEALEAWRRAAEKAEKSRRDGGGEAGEAGGEGRGRSGRRPRRRGRRGGRRRRQGGGG
jgi:poly(A) polymerase